MKMLVLVISLLASAAHASGEEDFAHWMDQEGEAIVYVWSPFMPLSVLGREDILAIAAALHVPVLTLVDPGPGVRDALGDAPVHARSLLEAGVLDHFPAIMLVHQGRLLPGVLHGYEQPHSLQQYIRDRLEIP